MAGLENPFSSSNPRTCFAAWATALTPARPAARSTHAHPRPWDPSTSGPVHSWGRRYDITEFVANHPGGNRILLGAGKSIDAYWNLYQQHLNSAAPMELLQSMQIGAALLSS